MRKILDLSARLVSAFLIVLVFFPRPALGGDPYLIGEGDVLDINVWENPHLNARVTVRPDGRISLPLIQDVLVAGLTVEQARKSIAVRLSGFVKDLNVSVAVAEANSYRVYTLGAVTVNGMFVLPAPKTALQLLAQAGGATAEADPAQMFLIRGEEKISLSFEKEMEGPGQDMNTILQPGDILMVPYRRGEGYVPKVLVIGEVRNPSAINFQEGMTVLDAFVVAGGGTEFADADKVKVIRREPDGRKDEIKVNLDMIMKKGDLTQNVALSPGDIIVVP